MYLTGTRALRRLIVLDKERKLYLIPSKYAKKRKEKKRKTGLLRRK